VLSLWCLFVFVVQSTDTGDYFPEDYNKDAEIAFTSGMMGSQATMGGNRGGPQLPGMENLGADAILMGGIAQNTDIPAGMTFVPSSVPDGSFEFNVASTSSTGKSLLMGMIVLLLLLFSKSLGGFKEYMDGIPG
jgi:hypothetical protein